MSKSGVRLEMVVLAPWSGTSMGRFGDSLGRGTGEILENDDRGLISGFFVTFWKNHRD